MTEEKAVQTVEAVALEKAYNLVAGAYPQSASVGAEYVGGRRWDSIDMTDDAAVQKRLREMADLIADLKNRMLK